MIDIINQLPQAVWIFIHFALVVPIAAWLNNYFKVGGTFLNQIHSKQVVAFLVAIALGYLSWAFKVGAIQHDAWFVVLGKSLLAGMGASGFYDMTKKKDESF